MSFLQSVPTTSILAVFATFSAYGSESRDSSRRSYCRERSTLVAAWWGNWNMLKANTLANIRTIRR
jgi:hypothetical protein